LQTLTLVMLVFNGQAVFYVARERRRIWSSMPSTIVIAASVAELLFIPTLAASGMLMTPIPVWLILTVLAAAVVLAFVLDTLKIAIFRRLHMV
jgi:H+-transporting ATPase